MGGARTIFLSVAANKILQWTDYPSGPPPLLKAIRWEDGGVSGFSPPCWGWYTPDMPKEALLVAAVWAISSYPRLRAQSGWIVERLSEEKTLELATEIVLAGVEIT